MIKTVLSVLALVAASNVAQAQSVETNPQRLRDVQAAHVANGSAGTVGAMEAYVQGLATSPDDVVLQQSGRTTTAGGARPINAVESVGYAPGTVGAAPGR